MYFSNISESDASRKPASILVIDESVDVRQLLKTTLRSSYQVLAVDNVDAALNILSDVRPNLVIAHHNMPSKKGLDGLREIHQLYPDVEIIMLTQPAREELIQEAIEMGGQERLPKPCDLLSIQQYIQMRLASHTIE